MSKTLVIAEKPSVGRDLSKVLPGPFTKGEGVAGGAGPHHHLGRRAPRAARRPGRVRPEVRQVADAGSADRAQEVQAGRARRALEEADDGRQARARPRRRRPGGQRLRRRARGRADLRLPVREGRQQAARPAAVAELDDQLRDQGRVRVAAPVRGVPHARGGGPLALGGGLDRRHERHSRRDDPAAQLVRRGRQPRPRADADAWRSSPAASRRSATSCPEPYWVVDARFLALPEEPRRAYDGRFHAGANPRIGSEQEAAGDRRRLRGQHRHDHQGREAREQGPRAAALRPHLASA